jgi:hypothetical protein
MQKYVFISQINLQSYLDFMHANYVYIYMYEWEYCIAFLIWEKNDHNRSSSILNRCCKTYEFWLWWTALRITELLEFFHRLELFIVENSFGNKICSRLQIMGETPTHLGPLKKVNLRLNSLALSPQANYTDSLSDRHLSAKFSANFCG